MKRRLRRMVLGIGTGAVCFVAAGRPAHGQSDTTPRAAAESTQAAVLFDSDEPLSMRIEVDLRTLVDDRDSIEREEHEATLTYRIGDAAPVSLDLKVRTRGHWRRQERNCDFPPLRLNFPRTRVGGTLFAGQDKLKLVTSCRPGRGDYDEYVLREYLPYRLYNLLTPQSLRARLVTTTFVDSQGREDSLTMQTFLLETAEQMAARNGGRLIEARGARFEDVDSLRLGLTAVFLYLIGGTDWSLSGLHNIYLVHEVESLTYVPVAFDFDWTGIVQTRYALPDSRLPIGSVRERLYRGPCLSEAHWNTILIAFAAQRSAIYALYADMQGLSPRYVRDTHRYLDEFYEMINDFDELSEELFRRCRAAEGF